MVGVAGRPEVDESKVLTKALLRAAEGLGLTGQDVAKVVGTSPATISRLRSGDAALAVTSKEAELALGLVRIYRDLDALMGGDAANTRAWFAAHNTHLGGVPSEMVKDVEGLVRVIGYLDAMRGKI